MSSKGWISSGAGSMETQSLFHNIKNTFSNQNGAEGEGEVVGYTCTPLKTAEPQKVTHKYGGTAIWGKKTAFGGL